MSEPAVPADVPHAVARREMVLLVAFAAIFRVLLLALLPRVVYGDEAAYLLLGRALWQDGAIPSTHPPLLPLLAGAVWRLTGNPELGTGLWFVVCGALLVVPVVRLAAAIAGRRTALLAGALVAVYPALSTGPIYWGSMTEPLFTALLYAAMWAAFRGARDERAGPIAAAGALFSLAYLTRPEGGLWMVTAVLALAGDRLLRRRSSLRATAGAAVLVVGAFVATALPYLVWLRVDTGRWTPSGKLAIAWEGGDAVMRHDRQRYDEVLTGLDAEGRPRFSSAPKQSLGRELLQHPGRLAERVAGNATQLGRRVLTQQILPLPLALLAAAALALRPRTRERFAGDLWLAACAVPVAAFVMFQIEARFFAPAAPALLVWAAAGTDELDRRLRAARRPALRAAFALAAAAAVVAAVGYGHGPALAERRASVFPSRRVAGAWLRANTPPAARVMAQDDTFGVYSDRPFTISPRLPYPEWIRYVRAHADYLVVEGDEVRSYRPYLAFLLDPARVPPELEPVHRVADPRDEVVVFRVRPAAVSGAAAPAPGPPSS